MTSISSASTNMSTRREMLGRSLCTTVSLLCPFAFGEQGANIAHAQSEQMPLNGRMRMAEYMPASANFRLPNMPFQDSDGNATSIEKFAGRPVIFTMWRTNCHVCHADMPELSRVRDSDGARGIEILPVSLATDSLEDVRNFYTKKNIRNLSIYRMISNDLFDRYAPLHPRIAVRATPTTILFDAKGNARLAIVGVRSGLYLPEGQELLHWLKTA